MKDSSVQWMQADKFARAELCINEDTEKPSFSTLISYSKARSIWFSKLLETEVWKCHECLSNIIISEKSISLEEVPNLLRSVAKVPPKVNKENVRVTQVHGSMEGKEILEKVSAMKEDKAKKELAQKERKSKHQQQVEAFFKCEEECTCGKKVCAATKLRECPCCHNVIKSMCSKSSCQDKTGSKPIMIKPFFDIRPKKSLQFGDDEDDTPDDDVSK